MEKVYIFCDEFGTSTLNQNDVKNITKFIYCAVVIRESNLEKARKVRDEISKAFLNGNKIKSSSSALKNDTKRLNCLNHLYENLNFITHFLIVDKEKLDQDTGGLRFRKVFYKFFQKIFFAEINNKHDEFEIYMHHLINPQFGQDLKSYLSKKINNSLFEKYNFLSDEKEPLIQFADLIAGSIGKCFNKDYSSNINNKIFEIIKPNIQIISFFPPEFKEEKSPLIENDEIDEEIFSIVKNDTVNLINIEIDDVKKTILEQLLWYQNIAPNVYLQTYEITNYLKYYLGKEISTETLRLIIRDLRFDGIIIVSANHKSGYKLAVSKSDVFQYFNHYSKYILPMLKKVQIANDIFKSKTVGEFKPLENFEDLNLIISALTKIEIIQN